MKAPNEAAITTALDRVDAKVRLFFLYGPDEATARALADRLGKALGGDAERIDLDGPSLRDDAGRLLGEASAPSLFGGKRWVRVTGGDETLPAIEQLLNAEVATDPVAVIAGALKGTSALVKRMLADKTVLAHQCWKPEGRNAEALVQSLGIPLGVRMASDVARRVGEAANGDRALMLRELEKFAAYLDAGPDRPRELTGDVLDLLSADAAEANAFVAVDAAFDGRPDVLAQELAMQESAGAIGLLRLAARRALLLGEVRAQVEQGRSAEQVVRTKFPYLKGPQGDATIRQAGKWPAERLARVAARLSAAEADVKSPLGDLAGWAELMAIARVAERLR